MSGEVAYVYGTPFTLESAGNIVPNNSVMLALQDDYNLMTSGLGYPDGQFALTCAFGVAPVEGSVISLYARPKDIDGTLDTQPPETTRPTLFIGNFVVNDVATTQTLYLMAYDLPPLAAYYLHNSGTGQQINGNWILKVKPRTYKAL